MYRVLYADGKVSPFFMTIQEARKEQLFITDWEAYWGSCIQKWDYDRAEWYTIKTTSLTIPRVG